MAQQDTGLGWSAKSEYLLSTGPALLGNLSKYYAEGYSNQPLAYCPTDADVHINGTRIGLVNGQEYYIGSNTEGAAIFITSTTHYQYAYSSVQNFSVRIAVKRSGDWVGHSTIDRSGSLDSTTQLYSARLALDTSHTWTYDASIFPDSSRGSVIKTSNAPYYKLNSGYAVAGLVSWLSLAGDILTTPVLISSDREAVKLSADGTTEIADQMIADNLHDGMHFYMSFLNLRDYSFTNETVPIIDLTQFGASQPAKVFKLIVDPSIANVQISNSPDPYETEGGGSGEEGGSGEDLEDDEMGISHHAIPEAINTGFCRIYCPTKQQLRDLSNFLWSAQFDLTAVKKLFANPMDSVLGLSAVPLTLGGANAPVYLGGVDTEMSFPMVSYQSYQVPMGAITVEKRWGSYLDYDPYTKFSIFLPFIGFKDLSADDIMGKQIILDYDVDILSGACTARLQAGGNVLYQWSGQCSIQLPVTASNWNQVFQSATSAALSAGLAVATGSAGPVLAGALAAEGVQAIMGKPRIERGGTASGAAGWMGGLTPYLVRVTPEAIIPSDQNKFIGYPAFSSISLGALTGYNEISSIHLEGIPATGAELDELEAILKGGVIF